MVRLVRSHWSFPNVALPMILMCLDKVGSYVPDDNHEGGKGPGSITTLPTEKYLY